MNIFAEMALRNLGASDRDLKRVLGAGISDTEKAEFNWLWKKAEQATVAAAKDPTKLAAFDAAFHKLQAWEKCHPEAFAFLFNQKREAVGKQEKAGGSA